MKKTALITGATSGIGRATALRLCRIGYSLIVTGRRADRLKTLVDEVEKEGGSCKTLCFDIQRKDELDRAMDSIGKDLESIDLLVNNAGLASTAEPIHSADWNDWERMIDTNVKGLLAVSQRVIPGMIQRRSGHIVNLSSIAGKETYANGNVYCATKHAVEALTKGMRIDLLQYGIKVSSISPGMVETEFSVVRYHGDQEKADAVYQGLTPLYAEDVAEAIEFIVTRPAHVNVNDLLLMPTAQASGVYNYRQTKNS